MDRLQPVKSPGKVNFHSYCASPATHQLQSQTPKSFDATSLNDISEIPSPVNKLRSLVFKSRDNELDPIEASRLKAIENAEKDVKKVPFQSAAVDAKEEAATNKLRSIINLKRSIKKKSVAVEEPIDSNGKARSLGFNSIKIGLSKREYEDFIKKSKIKPLNTLPYQSIYAINDMEAQPNSIIHNQTSSRVPFEISISPPYLSNFPSQGDIIDNYEQDPAFFEDEPYTQNEDIEPVKPEPIPESEIFIKELQSDNLIEKHFGWDKYRQMVNNQNGSPMVIRRKNSVIANGAGVIIGGINKINTKPGANIKTALSHIQTQRPLSPHATPTHNKSNHSQNQQHSHHNHNPHHGNVVHYFDQPQSPSNGSASSEVSNPLPFKVPPKLSKLASSKTFRQSMKKLFKSSQNLLAPRKTVKSVDFIPGFDDDTNESLFEHYSGMLFHDPSTNAAWKELNDLIRSTSPSNNSDSRPASALLSSSSTKRSLSAGRMINCYRPWGPARLNDPLDVLLQKSITSLPNSPNTRTTLRNMSESSLLNTQNRKVRSATNATAMTEQEFANTLMQISENTVVNFLTNSASSSGSNTARNKTSVSPPRPLQDSPSQTNHKTPSPPKQSPLIASRKTSTNNSPDMTQAHRKSARKSVPINRSRSNSNSVSPTRTRTGSTPSSGNLPNPNTSPSNGRRKSPSPSRPNSRPPTRDGLRVGSQAFSPDGSQVIAPNSSSFPYPSVSSAYSAALFNNPRPRSPLVINFIH